MICLSGNLPPLKVGRQKVIGYQTDWIERALSRAATAGGHHDCPFLAQISHGVVYFLEKRSSLQAIPIEDLYTRMRAMLCKIGCPQIARHLTPLAPPVTVSLIGPARLADRCSKETLFEILEEEIHLLHRDGAEQIRFRDLDAGVQLLQQKSGDLNDADLLKREIAAFLESHHLHLDSPHRNLQVTLES